MMEETDNTQAKSPSRTMTLAALAVLTLVAAGGGWVVGAMLAPPPEEKVETAAEASSDAHGKDKEGIPKLATEANGIVQLEPITTNLAYPSENLVRLEVALQFNGAPDVDMAEDIHQDIVSYLKTVSLPQIQGPRGFQYLRDDILERVDLRSDGRVTNVMFRTFIIQ